MPRTSISINGSLLNEYQRSKNNAESLSKFIIQSLEEIKQKRHLILPNIKYSVSKKIVTIFFSQAELNSIDKEAKSYRLTRSEFINVILRYAISTKKDDASEWESKWDKLSDIYFRFLNNYRASGNISAKEIMHRAMSHQFLTELDIGAGIFIPENKHLQLKELNRKGWAPPFSLALPIPIEHLRLPLDKNGLIVKSYNNNETYLSTEFWQMVKPVLIEQIWARVQSNHRMKFCIAIPLRTNVETPNAAYNVLGTAVYSFTNNSIRPKYVDFLEETTQILANILVEYNQ